MNHNHQHALLKVREFCINQYLSDYAKVVEEVQSKKADEVERVAQKSAIQTTFYKAIQAFPMIDASEVWGIIYNAHVHRKSGISDDETIRNVLSASQSWKKSSGHAFEEFIQSRATVTLAQDKIRIVLQRELNQMIKAHQIHNEPRDITWINEQLKGAVFDLYAIVTTNENKNLVFGCIQSKTSIRDRVTRDREPSLGAMTNFFWSVCITLDGEFLRMPKFRGMVNGGVPEFLQNGWHAMYVLSSGKKCDRIYPIDASFSIFCNHAREAAKFWLTQRQWFNPDWRAEQHEDK